MTKIYDVIIIGGGPAGSTAATNLAKKGFEVLVLEKEKFPRFHVGETLLPFCYQVFQKLGVLETMEREFSRKPGVTFSNEANTDNSNWCFNHIIKDESHLSFHVERSKFDDILLRNAQKNGAEVLEEIKVVKVDLDDEFVLVHSQESRFTAKFLIDASGQDSFLGKTKGLRSKNEKIDPRIAISTQWSGASLDETLKRGGLRIIHLEGDKKGWIWMIPIAKDKLSVGVVTDLSYFKEKKKALSSSGAEWLEKYYLDEVFSSVLGKQILHSASITRELVINSDYSYNVSHKFGANYAVIGDASAFLDPMFASGVYLAMQSAMLITDALGKKIRDNKLKSLTLAYEEIEGAYSLIEKMIEIYYNPEAVKFPEAEKVLSYSNQKDIFSIIHLVLAGDFFKNHSLYSYALDTLNSKKNIDRYANLTGHTKSSMKNICES